MSEIDTKRKWVYFFLMRVNVFPTEALLPFYIPSNA